MLSHVRKNQGFWFVTLVSFLATLPAVVVAAEGENESAREPCSATEDTVISVVAVSDGLDLERIQFTTYLEDETNVGIDWVQVPRAEFSERLRLLLAGKSLPDLLVTQYFLSKAKVLRYAEEELFAPLNDLIDRCAPDIKLALDSTEGQQFKERLTMPNGEMYSFPYIDYCYHCQYSRKMWVYQPWLDRLGLAVPATTGEFQGALRAYKERDANDNGIEDEIPLLGVFRDRRNTNPLVFLMNAFIYTRLRGDGALLLLDNGEVRFVADTDQWRDGLVYMSRLHEESLLRFKTFDEARKDIERGVVGFFPGTSYTVFAIEDPGLSVDYQPIAPLGGPSGLRQATTFPPSMWFTSHIASSAGAREDTIARLVNWWFVDPIKNNYLCEDYWVEGTDWIRLDESQGEWIGEDGFPAEARFVPGSEPGSGKITYDNGWSWSCFARWETRAYMAAVSVDETEGATDERGRLMIATRDLMEPYRAGNSVPPDVLVIDYDDFVRTRDALRLFVMERSIEFILGERDIDDDREWEEYLAGLSERNVDKYVIMWQEALDM